MLHAICDFCGENCGRTAIYLTLTPFSNFALYHNDTQPFGKTDETKGFVICSTCNAKHNLPNPYEFYETHALWYEEGLDGPNTHTGWDD